MNLLADQWMPVIRRDGARAKIAIHELLDDYVNNPVVDLESPRPDFYNALFQLLIGIVQVAAAPEDEEDWADFWDEPYSPDVFKEKILGYEKCFEIDSDGPAFMQDYSLSNEESKLENMTNLFINLPANEHYSGENLEKICPYWGAIALHTLQTFAPSGGRGHRVGLRGGGPLTSMLLPSPESTLWKKIWLNVISEEEVPNQSGNAQLKDISAIFPWMKATKISERGGTGLFPEECHPYHMYFGMPRRIRLRFEHAKGRCDLTNEECSIVVTGFRTRHSGNNYEGSWLHPLNSYREPRKSGELPISVKAQPGGVNYRHWMGIAFPKSTHILPRVLELARNSSYRKPILNRHPATLWVAGYDMDNMKARCWYESKMPVFTLAPDASKRLGDRVELFVEQARKLAKALQSTIKDAWFSRPKDAKGSVSFVGSSFWQNTETDFYCLLDRMVQNSDDENEWAQCAKQWRDSITQEAYRLFDQLALAQHEDGLDMRRVVDARNRLRNEVGKVWKNLNNYIEVE